MDEYILDDNISIHAPTRGATERLLNFSVRFLNFNPRSYKRSDSLTVWKVRILTLFQSTLLQEERPG